MLAVSPCFQFFLSKANWLLHAVLHFAYKHESGIDHLI